MLELQALGERLVELPPNQLTLFDLPDSLHEAVVSARGITARGGRKRQMQYIGKLMRAIDAAPIRAVFARLDGRDFTERAALHEAERWRTRLLDGGDAALAELTLAVPNTDADALRPLVHEATVERAAGRAPRRQRELFRALRALLTPPST